MTRLEVAPTTPTVPAKRIIAVSADPAFADRLAAALAMVGAVDVHRALDAAGGREAALWVIHLDGELAQVPADRWPVTGACPVIAVLPRSDLAATVELMRSSERIAGVVAADGFDPQQLAALATRIITDDALGMDKVMAGAQIHTRIIADHPDKVSCAAEISRVLEQIAAPRRHREPIEQCIDEMVMNALYDAPVDARGRPLFADTPIRTRIRLRSEHSAAVQYAHNGRCFAVSVRDAFGALDRQTVLASLYKCLHAERPVESRVGGAGVGLFLVVNSSTAVQFTVLPGIATEVLCVFDLAAPRLALAQLSFVVQRDPAGQVASGPSRRLRARRRPAEVVLAALVVIAVVLGILALVRALGPRTATVELDSQPTGAAVEIDGAPVGSTPLALTGLEPEASLSIVFRRTGYRAASVSLQVPAAGESRRLVQPLEAADHLVRVRFASQPPGAEVVRTGQPAAIDRTYTPAELFVEADQVQRFTLTMPGRVPLVIEPFTLARGARGVEKGGALVEGANLRIEATVDGKVTVSGAPHCADAALPLDCTLAPGRYVVEYRGPEGARFVRTVMMPAREMIERFELGIVEAAPGKSLSPSGARRAVLEVGTHTVTVSDAAGSHPAIVRVVSGATVIAE